MASVINWARENKMTINLLKTIELGLADQMSQTIFYQMWYINLMSEGLLLLSYWVFYISSHAEHVAIFTACLKTGANLCLSEICQIFTHCDITFDRKITKRLQLCEGTHFPPTGDVQYYNFGSDEMINWSNCTHWLIRLVLFAVVYSVLFWLCPCVR